MKQMVDSIAAYLDVSICSDKINTGVGWPSFTV